MELKELALENIKKLRSPDGWLYASIGRYECFFGRDAAITSLELLSYDSSIAKNSLLYMAKTQAKEFDEKKEEEPGRIILQERPKDDKELRKLQKIGWEFPYYGSPDSTLWFIFLAEEYLKKTKDIKTIKEIHVAITEALVWVEKNIDSLHFLRIKNLDHSGSKASKNRINKNWRDKPEALSYKNGKLPKPTDYPVAHLEVQALLYRVIDDGNTLMPFLNKEGKAIITKLVKQNQTLLKNIQNYFYIKDEEFYAPAINVHNKQFDIVTSIPHYLLFTQVATPEQAKLIKNRILQPDIFTLYGVRVLSIKEKQFRSTGKGMAEGHIGLFDNWILYEGLKNYEYTDEARLVRDAVFNTIDLHGYIPEAYQVDRQGNIALNAESTTVQAWCSGAVIALLEDDPHKKVPIKRHVLRNSARSVLSFFKLL